MSKPGDPTKNRCLDCSQTWFPGSMEKAMECPRCEGTNIEYGIVDRWPAYLITAALIGLVGTTLWTSIKIALAYFS